MDEKKTTPEKEAALKNLREKFKGTDTDSQVRLLMTLPSAMINPPECSVLVL